MLQQNISNYFFKNTANKEASLLQPSIIASDDEELVNFDSEHEEFEVDVLP